MRDSAALYASFRHHLAEIIARRPKTGDVAPAAPPPPAPKNAAEREFDRVKAAALLRIADEERAAAEAKAERQAAQEAEDRAVALILGSRAAASAHISN